MTDQQADYVCQVHVTASQSALVAAALQELIYTIAEDDGQMAKAERSGMLDAVVQLKVLFTDVAERPTAFPVRGQMARTLKTKLRRMKGPEQSKRVRARSQRRRAEEAARKAKRKFDKEFVPNCDTEGS